MRRLLAVSAVLLLSSVAACDDKEDGSSSSAADASTTTAAAAGANPSEPCDLTEPDVVADVFGGTVGAETPGTARNCSYRISRGAADDVEVYYFGTAEEWKGIKANYEVNRGPLTDLKGVGDAAFNPGDFKKNEVVVLQGDTIFAVGLGGVPTSAPVPEVRQLAQRIADDLG